MDFSLRLQLEAKKDRIKLIVGAGLMLLVLLAVVVLVFVAVQNRVAALLITGASMVAMFTSAIIFIMRLLKKMEHDSFGEGVHLVMESLPMNSVMLTRDLKIVYCNSVAPEMYGFKSRQEYQEGFFSLIPEFQPSGARSENEIARHIQTAMRDGKVTFEWWNKMPATGELIPTEVTLVKTFFEGEDHLLEFTRDMRASFAAKKNEEAFKERMQAIMDASPLVCAVYDADGNILEVNKEVEHVFGIPDKQIFMSHFMDFQPEYQPDGSLTAKKLVEASQEAVRLGSYRHEWMFQLRNGTPIPTEEVLRAVKLDDATVLISYIRDLREAHRIKERELQMKQQVQVLVQQLNGHVEEQSAAVTESAAAIEEMIANISSVTNALSKNAVQVTDLQSASEVGHTGLNTVVADVREIAKESESLMEINSVMQNIASQTNLLSMNAAIEAAHAGESGRGFAVVADEIRKLAESSSSQSKTIGAVLKKIKGAIDKITKSVENVLDKFDAIDGGVKTVAEQEHGVLNAMEEQQHGSKQVLQAMGQLGDITHRVKEDAHQMLEKQKETMK